MSLFRRCFLLHPASVDETYVQHLLTAASFGARMIAAGLACVAHGLLPAVFETRGSDTVRALHERMAARAATRAAMARERKIA